MPPGSRPAPSGTWRRSGSRTASSRTADWRSSPCRRCRPPAAPTGMPSSFYPALPGLSHSSAPPFPWNYIFTTERAAMRELYSLNVGRVLRAALQAKRVHGPPQRVWTAVTNTQRSEKYFGPSLRLDAGLAREPALLLEFRPDVPGEVLRRGARFELDAALDEALVQVRVAHCFGNRPVEADQRRAGGSRRRDEAVEGDGLVARNARFVHGRDLCKKRRARETRDLDRAYLG